MEAIYFYVMYTLRRRLKGSLGEVQAHALILFVDTILVSDLLFTFFAKELKTLPQGAYMFGLVLTLPLLALNLTLFKIDGEKWLKYERRFDSFTERQRRIASTLVEVLIVLIFASPLLLDHWVWS